MFNPQTRGDDEDLGRYFGIPGQFFDTQKEQEREKSQMDPARKRFLSAYWNPHPSYADFQPQYSPFGPVPRRLEGQKKDEIPLDFVVPPEPADHILSYSEGFELSFRNSDPFPGCEKGQNYEIRGEMTFVPDSRAIHAPFPYDTFTKLKTTENEPEKGQTGQKHRPSEQNLAFFTPAEPSKRALEGQPFSLYTSEKYGCVLFCDRSIAIDLDCTP